MAFSIGAISANVTANTVPFGRSMRHVQKQGMATARSVKKDFQGIGRTMQNVGSKLTKSLTLPIVAFGGASVKAFADFDSAMTQSTAIMDDVTADVRKDMEAAARSVSEQLTTTSKEAAESYFFLASAGLDAKQSIEALPQVAKFAQAGMFDMATATDLATDAQSALGLTVDDAAENMENMARVTDVLVKANTLANASVRQFSESLTNRAAAAMRSVNKEIEEGVAVLAAFADQGMKGQRAGEQFARIIRILSQEAAKNSEEFKDLGLIDAEGNLANMADIVESLTNELSGLSDSAKSARLKQLGFTARVQAAIKPLLGTADAIREYEEGLRRAAGITDEVAEKQLASLTSQFKILWNTIVNGAQAVGASIAETFDIKGLVKGFQESIKTGIKWFNNLSKETKKIAFTVAGVLGAGGPILLALGTLTTVLGAISWPAVLGVGAVGAAATAIISNWGKVEDYFTIGGGAQMWDDIKGIVRNASEIITNIWNAVGEDITETTEQSFGLAVTVIEQSLDSILTIMKKFNGEFDDELNVFEDNILTTLSKIDAKIVNFATSSLSVMAGWASEFGSFLGKEFIVDPLKQFAFWFGIGNQNVQKTSDSTRVLISDIDSALESVKKLQSFINADLNFSVAETESKAEEVSKVNIKKPFVELDNVIKDRLITSFGELEAVANRIDKSIGKILGSDLDNDQFDLSEKIFPPGSLGALEERLEKLREKLRFATDPEVVEQLQEKIADTNEEIEDFSSNAEQSGRNAAMAMGSLGNSIGNVIGQLMKGKEEALSFGNILSTIAPALINVLTGGTGGFGASLASGLFGGSFHSGGVVPGSGEKMALVKGGEGIFTKSQMESMGGMIQNGGNRTKKIQLNVNGELTGQGDQLRAVINESRFIELS